MRIKDLLKYEFKNAASMLAICIVFPLVVFWTNSMDFNHAKKQYDEMIDRYGTVEQARIEDPVLVDSIEKDDLFNGSNSMVMLGAGLFAGSIGLITEFFGVAMQMCISRKSLKWSYLIFSVIFTVIVAGLIFASNMISRQWFISQCTGGYEFLKPAAENSEAGIILFLRYLGIGYIVSIAGSAMWLITTRFKGVAIWVISFVIITVSLIAGIIAGLELDIAWLIYTVLAAAGVIFFLLFSRLIMTQTVEHKIR